MAGASHSTQAAPHYVVGTEGLERPPGQNVTSLHTRPTATTP